MDLALSDFSSSIASELNQFLEDHIVLQIHLFNYSSLADRLGFNGFAHWLQVQAQDEVLHQRKIMNYLFQRDVNFAIKVIDINQKVPEQLNDVCNILQVLHQTKRKFLDYTHKLVKLAKSENDYTTVHFLDWFLADFAEEIEVLKVLKDQYCIANGVYDKWDREQGKRKEPETLKVITPFYKL